MCGVPENAGNTVQEGLNGVGINGVGKKSTYFKTVSIWSVFVIFKFWSSIAGRPGPIFFKIFFVRELHRLVIRPNPGRRCCNMFETLCSTQGQVPEMHLTAFPKLFCHLVNHIFMVEPCA